MITTTLFKIRMLMASLVLGDSIEKMLNDFYTYGSMSNSDERQRTLEGVRASVKSMFDRDPIGDSEYARGFREARELIYSALRIK